ncbi:cell division protein FtsX [Parasphingorhabdus halotolerans]|uniref:Cell division protein n=1 Tax=Parasphingorhabdus halotolerans TaxID=2725558 RepID=A0A6H2DP18_9SPHN|nr:FtsX-like permease family protein [Parasphingorhabdus halotolerans]QJB69705.1 cell division protein [Parasphingorhabdus halotolerans]
MLDFFVIPAHDRRLIPEGRLSGPMPWVVAIMIFLTVLAAAAGLAFSEAARSVTDELSSRATVQIVEANPDSRTQQTNDAAAGLRGLDFVSEVRVLPQSEIEALIEPWLGTEGLAGEIPIPALIDLKLDRPVNEKELQALRNAVKPLARSARVEPSSGFISPVISLVRSLQWIAAGLVALLALATGAATIIAARAALNTHRETISVIHLLGATDRQISRLFQRRIALDALLGGLLGLLGGGLIVWLVSMQVSALGSGLIQSLGLSWISWLIIAAIPIMGMLIAMFSARMTIMGALRKIL